MRIARQHIFFLIILILVACVHLASAVEIDIAGETIQIPAPVGFTKVSSLSKDRFRMFEDVCGEKNRLLAVFVSQQDAGLLLRDDSATLQEYMIVHSVKSLEGMTLAKYQFSEVRSRLRKEYASVFRNQEGSIGKAVNKASETLSRRLSADVDFNVSGIAPLGIDEESASSITMSQLAKLDMSVAGEKVQYVVAYTTTALLVKGRVLYLNVYRRYQGEEDLTWTRNQSRKWLPPILAANSTTVYRSTGAVVPEGIPVDFVTEQLLLEEQVEYKLKSHSKAHDLDISIKYPKSWRAEEGIRPHIVQKFTGETIGRISPSCMLVVQELPAWASLLLEGDVAAEIFDESLQEMLPPNATYLDGGKTKIDGEPGAWLKYHYESERVGVRAGIYSLQYLLFYRGKMLVVNCGVAGLADDRELLQDAFASYLPVFQQIANSTVIHEKWENTGSDVPIMGDVGGQPWWVMLILSAVLTWSIGLAPPLLIRFAFARRPLSKGVSIGLVLFFLLTNIVVFTALGSKSKTHMALFLVAAASYTILHKGYVKIPPKDESHKV